MIRLVVSVLLVVLTANFAQSADGGGPALSGRVVDANGIPLEGARIDVSTAAPRVGRGLFCPSCYLDCRKSVVSDTQGRFEISQLDPTLKFRLLVTMPGKRALQTDLLDPLQDHPDIRLEPQPTDWPEERTLRGKVVDENGQPVEGALVEAYGAKTTERRWWGRVDVESVVSDAAGEFAMLLPDGYVGIDVQITSDGHSGTTTELLSPGSSHRIPVPMGTKVTGRIVHDGSPVEGLHVAVVQEERSAGHHFIKAVADVTDAEGRFVFEYLPADEAYVIYSLVGDGDASLVITTKRFMARASGATRDLGDLAAVPAIWLAGQIDLPPGVTLPDDARLSLDRDPAWDLASVKIEPDGTFAIGGLPPETYSLRLGAQGIAIDTSQLNYQALRGNSFGIRLNEPLEDLHIPVFKQ
jgi:uncharacterized GH25 family protein